MQGKICVVTGANTGIGKATVFGLAKRGATVVMVSRSPERGEAAQEEIIRNSGNQDIHLMLADLSVQSQIRRLAADFKSQFSALHVLVNNAGIIPRKREVTEDGFEMQLAVNHLAYFLLTNLLLDVLKAGAPARIVNVSSGAHWGAKLDFDDLQVEKAYLPNSVYARTKLMNVLFTYELARRLAASQVSVNCLDPGSVDTNMYADYMGVPRGSSVGGISPEAGARTSLYLATSPEVEAVTGQYFRNERAERSSPLSYDEALAAQLWEVSAELTGLSEA